MAIGNINHNLSKELISLTFSFLPAEDFPSASAVCKLWNKICLQEAIPGTNFKSFQTFRNFKQVDQSPNMDLGPKANILRDDSLVGECQALNTAANSSRRLFPTHVLPPDDKFFALSTTECIKITTKGVSFYVWGNREIKQGTKGDIEFAKPLKETIIEGMILENLLVIGTHSANKVSDSNFTSSIYPLNRLRPSPTVIQNCQAIVRIDCLKMVFILTSQRLLGFKCEAEDQPSPCINIDRGQESQDFRVHADYLLNEESLVINVKNSEFYIFNIAEKEISFNTFLKATMEFSSVSDSYHSFLIENLLIFRDDTELKVWDAQLKKYMHVPSKIQKLELLPMKYFPEKRELVFQNLLFNHLDKQPRRIFILKMIQPSNSFSNLLPPKYDSLFFDSFKAKLRESKIRRLNDTFHGS